MLEKSQLENSLPGSCTTWKMLEWKMHTMENNRKCTDWKMTENTQPEQDRMKNAQPRSDKKGTPLKMIENSCMYIMENDKKTHTGKGQKITIGKCSNWKLHNLENASKKNANH